MFKSLMFRVVIFLLSVMGAFATQAQANIISGSASNNTGAMGDLLVEVFASPQYTNPINSQLFGPVASSNFQFGSTLNPLADGVYYLRASVDTALNGPVVIAGEPFATSPPVVITGGIPQAGINLNVGPPDTLLTAPNSISGTIIYANGLSPVDAYVTAFPVAPDPTTGVWGQKTSAYTNAVGQYLLPGLLPSTYDIFVDYLDPVTGFRSPIFPNGDQGGPVDGYGQIAHGGVGSNPPAQFAVTQGQALPNINAQLYNPTFGTSISGSITHASGLPAIDVYVTAFNVNTAIDPNTGLPMAAPVSVAADASGNYVFPTIMPGIYNILVDYLNPATGLREPVFPNGDQGGPVDGYGQIAHGGVGSNPPAQFAVTQGQRLLGLNAQLWHNPDSDYDGINDAWEILHFHDLITASSTTDFNQDGKLDIVHFGDGTFPGTKAAVATGQIHTIALKQDGTLLAWGGNWNGELGDGTSGLFSGKSNPVVVIDLAGNPIVDIVAVAVSPSSYGGSSYALRSDGTVLAWGSNVYGQLGDGTSGLGFSGTPADKINPVLVRDVTGNVISNITAIAAGTEFAVAVKSDGSLLAWGRNSQGQLGDGSSGAGTDKKNPVVVVDALGNPISGVGSVNAGYGHTLALKLDGTMLAWGDNSSGQIGDGTWLSRNNPVVVRDAVGNSISGIVEISVSFAHSIALKDTGTLLAWGRNAEGQLGDGSVIPKNVPITVVDPLSNPVSGIGSINAGFNHNLVVKSDGTLLAWGDNVSGQVGDGSFIKRLNPTIVQNALGSAVFDVQSSAAGVKDSVVLKNDGTLLAWGYNYYGQLGDGTAISRSSPVQVTDVTGAPINLGFRYSVSGTVNNNSGQIGSVLVGLFRSPDATGAMGLNAVADVNGNYSIGNVPNGAYYVFAYVDVNGNSAPTGPDVNESSGGGNFVSVVGAPVAGVNMTINLYPDLDGDGIGDFWDLYPTNPNYALQADTDGDGLPDAWEMTYFGNLTTANQFTDSNGNGILDIQAFNAGTNPVGPAITERHDFSGDGSADILWRNAVTGYSDIWTMSAAGKTGRLAVPRLADVNWIVAGVGDFNADGSADILWRNIVTGYSDIWTMSAAGKTGRIAVPRLADVNWIVAGVGDFNADGSADILWRNTVTGYTDIWTMSAAGKTGRIAVPRLADVNWTVAGVGDFNADGSADILWRNTVTGYTDIWTMSAAGKTGRIAVPRLADINWAVAGVGDFNADGSADILWRNTVTGYTDIWTMSVAGKTGRIAVPRLADVNWNVAN